MDRAAYPIPSDGHHEADPAAGLPIPEPVLSQSNPYAPSAVNGLSTVEAEVLGEYARMSDNLERVSRGSFFLLLVFGLRILPEHAPSPGHFPLSSSPASQTSSPQASQRLCMPLYRSRRSSGWS